MLTPRSNKSQESSVPRLIASGKWRVSITPATIALITKIPPSAIIPRAEKRFLFFTKLAPAIMLAPESDNIAATKEIKNNNPKNTKEKISVYIAFNISPNSLDGRFPNKNDVKKTAIVRIAIPTSTTTMPINLRRIEKKYPAFSATPVLNLGNLSLNLTNNSPKNFFMLYQDFSKKLSALCVVFKSLG